MSILSIKNLKIPAKHGVYDFEKNKTGIFEIDIHVHSDLANAMKSDDLRDSVDYAKLVELVKRVFLKRDYKLIEYAAGKICEEIMKKYSVEKVIVKVRKPHAPINADLDTVEVEVEQSRKQ
tara:strand:+ start:224 stop:586 length:363 start_codon:yes stop_codon:yes gene_type:complete